MAPRGVEPPMYPGPPAVTHSLCGGAGDLDDGGRAAGPGVGGRRCGRVLPGDVRARHRGHRGADSGRPVRRRRAHGAPDRRVRGYYIDARTGRIAVPRCWQATWDVAGDDHLLIAQHLLLGANAHINHDLALAVVEVAEDVGGLASLEGDFHAINDVLAASFTGVIRDLDRVSRWAGEAAALGGGRLFNFSLRVARAEAWDAAVRLEALADADRRAYEHELDELVSVLAYLITRPVFPLGLGVWVARRFELHDAATVTRTLLGPG